MHIYPSDIDFRWENATKESWAEFNRWDREKIEAQNIISEFKKIRQAPGRNKALVIMNYRHAFPHLRKNRFEREENTGRFLMEAFPGRVANLMLNSVRPLPGSTPQRAVITALQEGRWDAAFAMCGNPNLGFDLQGTPFGQDPFDYFPFIRTQLRYQDVFTGFVFFKPLEAHQLAFGLPGLIDRSFADELFRRYGIVGASLTPEEVIREIDTLAAVHISSYENDTNVISRSDCSRQIQRWLKPKP